MKILGNPKERKEKLVGQVLHHLSFLSILYSVAGIVALWFLKFSVYAFQLWVLFILIFCRGRTRLSFSAGMCLPLCFFFSHLF